MRVLLRSCVIACLATPLGAAHAQEMSDLRRRATSLVVGVQGRWKPAATTDTGPDARAGPYGQSRDTAQGSGIVVGIRGDTVFVVTAAHILIRGKERGPLADSAFVAFGPQQ